MACIIREFDKKQKIGPEPGNSKHSTRQQVWKPNDYGDLSRKVIDLCARIELEWGRLGFQHPEIRIRTVLEEAALNAWIHGNKKNPEARVIIRWGCDDQFRLEVIDEGQGFDLNDIPDPTTSENLTKPDGRGIFIMRYFANEIAWEQDGKHLVAKFKKDFNLIF